MANKKVFSIILPTYTGLATIGGTFKSILNQKKTNVTYEVIVIIDGPSKEIAQVVKEHQKKFEAKKITFQVIQFLHNKGRFEARIAGAQAAKYARLLFIDDRAQIEDDFISRLEKINHQIAVPNIIELPSDNIISQTLFFIRRRVYGERWGRDFEDYYIDRTNFESSPKGTTCLWINKHLFLKICQEVARTSSSNKFVNEDTRILRAVVNKRLRIFRTSRLKAYYSPRSNFRDTTRHLYERGPRFVDYYSKPGTRFFPVLLSIYLGVAATVIMVILAPEILVYLLTGFLAIVMLSAMMLAKNLHEYLKLIPGLVLLAVIFPAGVIKGTIIKLAGKGQLS